MSNAVSRLSDDYLAGSLTTSDGFCNDNVSSSISKRSRGVKVSTRACGNNKVVVESSRSGFESLLLLFIQSLARSFDVNNQTMISLTTNYPFSPANTGGFECFSKNIYKLIPNNGGCKK